MASPSNLKEKSVVIEEEEILCPLPLAMYDPHQIEHEQDPVAEDIDQEEAGHEERVPQSNHASGLKSRVKSIKIGHYEISTNDEEEIQERDKDFKSSPEFERYKNSWIPVSERLKGWRIVTRQRANEGRLEKFYYHNSLTRQLRSKKEVYGFIRYGFLPTPNERQSSSEAAENLRPKPKRQRSQTPKEVVEAFLAESRNNLINYKG